ncbi:hypothetical protein JOD82_001881 [Paenibacillus sp. 1182]|uniref:hypothetical protein n=1 Tax=Paenibacillus sp. 1182 TaxID=2806565 RepID=UPI001AE314B6|nr:hypothetical protein [Paenibacillus sp. 1182]MBP1308861.1 hypothetical protein [Paenibacillus sp. 1182]
MEFNLDEYQPHNGKRYVCNAYKGFRIIVVVASQANLQKGLGGGSIRSLIMHPLSGKFIAYDFSNGNWQNGYIPPEEIRSIVEDIVRYFDSEITMDWNHESKKIKTLPRGTKHIS